MKVTVNGLNDLEKRLIRIQNNISNIAEEQQITLPYSEEEWECLTDYEKNEVIEEAKNNYIKEIRKEILRECGTIL